MCVCDGVSVSINVLSYAAKALICASVGREEHLALACRRTCSTVTCSNSAQLIRCSREDGPAQSVSSRRSSRANRNGPFLRSALAKPASGLCDGFSEVRTDEESGGTPNALHSAPPADVDEERHFSVVLAQVALRNGRSSRMCDDCASTLLIFSQL